MAVHSVNIAQLRVAAAPDTFSALGLGSCIGVVLYDPDRKIGGMIHILLPNAAGHDPGEAREKFADPGIYELERAVLAAGTKKERLIAKLAGGAVMLSGSEMGKRNLEASLRVLANLRIPIVAQDTGGTFGRSVTFDLATGEMRISTLTRGKTVI